MPWTAASWCCITSRASRSPAAAAAGSKRSAGCIPARGLFAPAKFIGLAEETGLIEAIGAWVLETACRQQKAWAQQGIVPARVAVNLSSRQLNRRQLTRDVAALINRAGVAPAALELEVTETAAMYDVARALPILHELGLAPIYRQAART